jgi:4-diphosphocytidyl-2-C-methyl-D-erythritol kinase
MVTERAYAKINLTLDVVGKRADGFHDIESVMHSLSLCDELHFSFSPSPSTEISLKIKGNDSLPTDGGNLIVRAAVLYLERIGETLKADVTLDKRIPSSAGLGGGSSDAAATLRAMNAYFNGRLSENELLSLGASLGSDVPYCLFGGTALCRGRGELLTAIETDAKGIFVIAIGSDSVSTPKAYAELDRIYSDFKEVDPVGTEKNKKMLESLSRGEISVSSLYNVFEDAAIPTCPSVSEIKKIMTASGALGSLMSGSGPSVFGIFDSEDTALSARDILEANGYKAFLCKSN